MNKLYIITGPAGVGKSTISKSLAVSLPKSVLIEGDTIYNFFVSDRISPWKPNAPLDLFWSNSIYLIKSYLEKGYNVIFNYIISPTNLKRITEEIKHYEINFSLLIASPEVLIKRDKLQEEAGFYEYSPITIEIDATNCKTVKDSTKLVLEKIKLPEMV